MGGIFGAKGTRRTYVTHQGEIEYTVQTRENDFQNAEKYAQTNETARTGVEAAVVIELLVKKIPTISLKRIKPNPSSPILKYVRDKNKNVISEIDLTIDYPDFTIKQNAYVPSTELFVKTFDKISQFGKEDVSEKALINSLLETRRFDEHSAKNHITMAMRNGIIFERRAGFYAKG